jgi:hypothetical protein
MIVLHGKLFRARDVPPKPGNWPWARPSLAGNRHEAGVLPPHIVKDISMLGTILIVVLLLLLLGAFPSWPYSRSWGYYPSGTLGLVLVIVLVLALLGRI